MPIQSRLKPTLLVQQVNLLRAVFLECLSGPQQKSFAMLCCKGPIQNSAGVSPSMEPASAAPWLLSSAFKLGA